jgi:TatD DNase family protein
MTAGPEHAAIELVDSHCHLYDTRGVELAEVLDAAQAAGVVQMITVGCDAATTAAAIAIAEQHPHVFATAGLHPCDVMEGLEAVTRFISHPRVIAVGETGLDYHPERPRPPRDLQREAFAAQIQLAHQHDLPLIIHTRDAWADTFDVLRAEGVPERTIFHCFTGGPDEARACVDLGAFLSFSGIVTFKGSTDVQDAARWCPLERMLVETDSPYLAPTPHRGRTNHPANVAHVAQFVADLRDLPLATLAASTVATTRSAFPCLVTGAPGS